MQGNSNSLALIGLGSVGRRLARRWQSAGFRVLSYSRSRESRARARAEGLAVEDEWERALSAAETIVVCVDDAQLAPVAQRLAEELRRRLSAEGKSASDPRRGDLAPVCLHTSGSRDASVLAPLSALGCSIGTLHPLAAFAPDGSGPQLEGAWCVIHGDARARASAAQLVAALGARVLDLNESASAAASYHAAAALLSNGTVALTSIALELAQRACRDPEQARLALISLLRATLANLEQHSPERALTGPVSRADIGTIQRHLSALEGDGDALALYRLLSKQMLALALRDGRLGASEARAVERVLAQ